jgi:predicted NodU family carbamoyl transferase
MNILGVSCYFHDAAAALLRDGKLIAAAEEERFSRKKHDYEFPQNAINFCLQVGGMRAEELDYVVFLKSLSSNSKGLFCPVGKPFRAPWAAAVSSPIRANLA